MKIKNIFSGLFLVCLLLLLVACTKNSNQTAEQNEEKGRYITVINKTGEVIKKLTISVDEGTEVSSLMNPYSSDTDSISIEIPKEYEEHSKFTIVLTSRHDFVYMVEKTIEDSNGRFEVTVKEDDKSKDGNWLDKFFNDSKE